MSKPKRCINAQTTEMRRSIETLRGMIAGIAADGVIEKAELEHLKEWLAMHKSLASSFPFYEAAELTREILEDGVVDQEEAAEFVEFATFVLNYTESGEDVLTAEMTELHGFLSGIAANEVVTASEVQALRNWLRVHDSNRDRWPYSESVSLVERILADGIVTAEERDELLRFTSGFLEEKTVDQTKDRDYFADRWMRSDAPVVKTIDMLFDPVSVNTVEGKLICFTGQMEAGTRKEVQSWLENAGGVPKSSVTMNLDYLVVGDRSNPAWAYAKYGRKVEKVMQYRQKGANSAIVPEKSLLPLL